MNTEQRITELDGYINPVREDGKKRYDGQLQDIRGAWKYLKQYIRELDEEARLPWYKRILRRGK